MSLNHGSTIPLTGLTTLIDFKNAKTLVGPVGQGGNVHPNPFDIYAWANLSTGNNCQLSRDYGVDKSPAMGIPLRMDITGLDPYTLTYSASKWNLAPTVAGDAWAVTVWAKASTATTGSLFLLGADAAGSYLSPSGSASNINITTSWQRFTYSYAMTNASLAYIHTRLDGPDTGGAGVTIWWDGYKLEKLATSTIYDPISNTPLRIQGTPTVDPRGYITFANDQITQWVGASNFPHPTGDITQSIWYKQTLSQPHCPIHYSSTGNNEYMIFVDSNTQISFWTINASFAVNTFTNLIGPWVNITRSRVASTGVENVYQNGKLIATFTIAAGNFAANKTLVLGQEQDAVEGSFDTNQNLDGSIGHVAMYNRVLTDAEVNQIFQATRGRYGV